MTWIYRHRHPVLIFFMLLIAYCYVLPRWSDWSQNSRLDLVLALGDDGTVVIDRYVANTGDYALYEGHAYSDKAPGPAFLALPVYLGLRPIIDTPLVAHYAERLGQGGSMSGTLRPDGSGLQQNKVRFALIQYLLSVFVVALPAALIGVLVYGTLVRLGLGQSPALVGTLAYGLATAAVPYSGNFYSHQVVSALLFGAFAVVFWRTPLRSAGFGNRSLLVNGVLCGLLLGWAVISEYPVALLGAGVALYGLYRHGWRWALPLVLGGVVPLVLLAFYDMAAFGTPLPVGYSHSALWQGQHQTGFLSLTFPHPEALWGLTFGSFRGLFFRAPWLLLAIPGFVLWWRSGRERGIWWLTLVGPLSIVLFYSASVMWWGGFGAGPRYIVPIIPFLALPAVWAIGQVWSKGVPRLATIALVLLSAALTWVETVAGQLFPTDAIRDTWSGYVLPAWAQGDIARNLGMALGLRGPWSLLPLLAVTLALIVLAMLPLKDNTFQIRFWKPRSPHPLTPSPARGRGGRG